MQAGEAKRILKEVLAEYGFVPMGKEYCKRISEGYSLKVLLDKKPSSKEYAVDLGAVFEPETAVYDISEWFLFTIDPEDPLEKYDLTVRNLPRQSPLTEWFDYENRSEEEFRKSLQLNLQVKLSNWQNPEYALDHFRNNWILFRGVSDETLEKIARLAGLDANEVREVRNSKITQWPRDYFDGSETLLSLTGCRLERCFRVGSRADLLLKDEVRNIQFELKIHCGLRVICGGKTAASFENLLPLAGETIIYDPRKPEESPVAFDRDMAGFIDETHGSRISNVEINGGGAFDLIFDSGSRVSVFSNTENEHADLWAIRSETLPALLIGSGYGCWYQ